MRIVCTVQRGFWNQGLCFIKVKKEDCLIFFLLPETCDPVPVGGIPPKKVEKVWDES